MVNITEPKILTAKTFYWSPGSAASQRRNNESRRLSEVEIFLYSLGFDIIKSTNGKIKGIKDEVEVIFYYSESCKNVYKRFEIYKDGKRSNITTLRKMYN